MPADATDSTAPEQHPERFDPEAAGGRLIDAEHRARYWAAASLVEGADVLDAGCGTGYGTEILLAAGAALVTGVDVAEEAVEATRRRAPEATVDRADLHALPYEDGRFDVVVCFEVIEHLHDQGDALDELRRVLRPGGLLVVSSPNPGVYPAGNPHHVRELAPDELEAALRERFTTVALHRQHSCLSSAILGDPQASAAEGPLAVDSRLLSPLRPGAETYAIALASDGPLPEPTAQLAVTGSGELQWFQDRIVYLEQHLATVEEARESDVVRLMREADLLRARAEEAERRFHELGSALLDLEARNATLADMERRFQESRDERRRYEQDVQRVLAEKDEHVARAQQALRAVESSASWRLTRPLRRVKGLLASR